MFGLFGKKQEPAPSTVAAEVGARLQRHAALPAKAAAPARAAFPECEIVFAQGTPPQARWVEPELTGGARKVYRVPASGSVPPLAILPTEGERPAVTVWELGRTAPYPFEKARSVKLEGQEAWLEAGPVGAACLPGQKVALAVSYHDPAARKTLFIYDAAANRFTRGDDIVPDRTGPAPHPYLESLVAAPQALLLMYYTDETRMGTADYMPRYNHIVLYSPRYPDGLKVARIGLDDGNVRGWAMDGKTLWLQTVDRRKPQRELVWSLDLSNVL